MEPRLALLVAATLCVVFAGCGNPPDEQISWDQIAPADSSFTLAFPADLLHARVEGDHVILHHQVLGPRRPVFCGSNSEPESASSIVDFHYSISLQPKPETWSARRDSPWFFGDCELGGLTGVETRIGSHGCGARVFTLEVDESTLISVQGHQQAELRTSKNRAELLAVPGVLSPLAADSLLSNVIATLRLSE